MSTSGIAPPNTTTSPITIDVKPFFSGTDICSAINAAIASAVAQNPSILSLTLDARGITKPSSSNLTCASNPFHGFTQITGRLLLGGVTINTTVQWTMPIQYFWIEGTAMSNMSAAPGTVIKAATGFGCAGGDAIPVNVSSPVISGCPVVFISGSGFTNQGYDSLGTGIRNLAIDCNSISSCIGAGSFNTQEGGGIDSVAFLNNAKACVVFDANEVSHLGNATGVSNPFLRNMTCTFLTSATSGIGIYVNAQDGPAEISNITVSVPGAQSSNPIISTCLEFNGGRGTNVNYFHCEHAQTAEVIGDSTLVHDVTVNGLTASATEVGVLIKNTSDYDISVESVGLVTGPSTPPVAVTDNVNGVSTAGMTVAKYVIGAASIASGGASFTTDGGGGLSINYVQPSKVEFISATLNQLTTGLTGFAPTGSIAYCSDCQPNSGASVCSSGGTGALAVRQWPTTPISWYCK